MLGGVTLQGARRSRTNWHVFRELCGYEHLQWNRSRNELGWSSGLPCARKVDVGFVCHLPVDFPALRSEVVSAERVVLAVQKGPALARRRGEDPPAG